MDRSYMVGLVVEKDGAEVRAYVGAGNSRVLNARHARRYATLAGANRAARHAWRILDGVDGTLVESHTVEVME